MGFKEYFVVIMAVTLVGSVVIALSPGSNFSKHIRLLCGVCTTACVMLPLISFVVERGIWNEDWVEMFRYDVTEENYYDEIYNNALLGAENKNAEKMLKNEIIKEFSMDDEEFDVQIIVGKKSEGFFVERIEVLIHPEGVAIDPHALKKYIEARIDCECEIIYDF